MLILGIETSCDETAVAVVRAENGNISVISNIVSSQVKLHAKWGGVVPNLAAREHLKNILPVLEESLKKAKITPEEIDLIAVTEGPGLIPALLIGVDTAKTLSYLWKKPLMGIHHIEGHIYANFISPERDKVCAISNFQFPISPPKADQPRADKQFSNSNDQISKKTKIRDPRSKNSNIKFPILCLVVSGGHTQLVLMKKHLQYEIIGQTLDDAVGEAFDKVARILGLGYPGGPAIAKCAKRETQSVEHKTKNATRYALRDLRLPRPMINSKDFNFSFSGLKTAVLYKVKNLQPKAGPPMAEKASLAAEFQQATIDVLVSKTIAAAKKYNPKTIMLAGGVAANKELREQLGKAIHPVKSRRSRDAYGEFNGVNYQLPTMEYTGDNAAMIASAAYFRFKNIKNKSRLKDNWKKLEADAGLKLK